MYSTFPILSLLAAPPAPPDLSPPLGLGGSPVMGGAQRSQRSTSRSGSKGCLPPRAPPWSHRPGAITAPTIVYPRPDTPGAALSRSPTSQPQPPTGGYPPPSGVEEWLSPARFGAAPAPADPQQERLKNRVIAAFQMQQLVEELAQREQAASDAADRCRDLEGRLSVAGRRPRGAAGRGSAACEGLIGTLQAATAALSPRWPTQMPP
ncbi:hypothetical protein PAPYR_11999 [Paratrimastix pyriformis]|uniref:Uncharacterized protein n=1 Tax=Paratrimastix pyriformis TaxID=342808 RepID=A0ABQ8U2M6_9EUKA|nr:hypothetical protein PAPYR_11999 [Paratrimastix pyriformis]